MEVCGAMGGWVGNRPTPKAPPVLFRLPPSHAPHIKFRRVNSLDNTPPGMVLCGPAPRRFHLWVPTGHMKKNPRALQWTVGGSCGGLLAHRRVLDCARKGGKCAKPNIHAPPVEIWPGSGKIHTTRSGQSGALSTRGCGRSGVCIAVAMQMVCICYADSFEVIDNSPRNVLTWPWNYGGLHMTEERTIAGGKIGGYVHKINGLRRALESTAEEERPHLQERLDLTIKTVAGLREKRNTQKRARKVLPGKNRQAPVPQES